MQDMKTADQFARHENAKHEIAGHEKQDNARCKICTTCCRPGITVQEQ